MQRLLHLGLLTPVTWCDFALYSVASLPLPFWDGWPWSLVSYARTRLASADVCAPVCSCSYAIMVPPLHCALMLRWVSAAAHVWGGVQRWGMQGGGDCREGASYVWHPTGRRLTVAAAGVRAFLFCSLSH